MNYAFAVFFVALTIGNISLTGQHAINAMVAAACWHQAHVCLRDAMQKAK